MSDDLADLIRRNGHLLKNLSIMRTWSGQNPKFQANLLLTDAHGFYRIEHDDDPVKALIAVLKSLDRGVKLTTHLDPDPRLKKPSKAAAKVEIDDDLDEFF